MGRKPNKPGAIPRLRARLQKSGTTFYYYDHGGKPRRETPLGSDYGHAIRKWAELERESAIPPQAVLTFRWVATQYMAEVAVNKAARTLADNRREVLNLLDFFDDPPGPLDAIRPVNVRQYLTWRTAGGKAQVRANREKALLSAIWNYARDRGYTDKPNPCAGIKGHRETGRDVYIEQDQYDAIWAAGDDTLRDAMDLAYLTGQRPADVMRMSMTDVRGGIITVRQGKTGKKLRIAVSDDLQAVIGRIEQRKAAHTIHTLRLVVNSHGRPVGTHAISTRFQEACKKAGISGVQFRDLRAKAGTDKAESAGDIRQAQEQLGHGSVVTTEGYVRNRRGKKVTPTR